MRSPAAALAWGVSTPASLGTGDSGFGAERKLVGRESNPELVRFPFLR